MLALETVLSVVRLLVMDRTQRHGPFVVRLFASAATLRFHGDALPDVVSLYPGPRIAMRDEARKPAYPLRVGSTGAVLWRVGPFRATWGNIIQPLS